MLVRRPVEFLLPPSLILSPRPRYMLTSAITGGFTSIRPGLILLDTLCSFGVGPISLFAPKIDALAFRSGLKREYLPYFVDYHTLEQLFNRCRPQTKFGVYGGASNVVLPTSVVDLYLLPEGVMKLIFVDGSASTINHNLLFPISSPLPKEALTFHLASSTHLTLTPRCRSLCESFYLQSLSRDADEDFSIIKSAYHSEDNSNYRLPKTFKQFYNELIALRVGDMSEGLLPALEEAAREDSVSHITKSVTWPFLPFNKGDH